MLQKNLIVLVKTTANCARLVDWDKLKKRCLACQQVCFSAISKLIEQFYEFGVPANSKLFIDFTWLELSDWLAGHTLISHEYESVACDDLITDLSEFKQVIVNHLLVLCDWEHFSGAL